MRRALLILILVAPLVSGCAGLGKIADQLNEHVDKLEAKLIELEEKTEEVIGPVLAIHTLNRDGMLELPEPLVEPLKKAAESAIKLRLRFQDTRDLIDESRRWIRKAKEAASLDLSGLIPTLIGALGVASGRG